MATAAADKYVRLAKQEGLRPAVVNVAALAVDSEPPISQWETCAKKADKEATELRLGALHISFLFSE